MLAPYRDRETRVPALSRQFQLRLERELDPGETLLWCEVPEQRRLWQSSLAVVPFALFWNAFVAFWMWNAARASFPFSLFGVPFALVGLYLLTTPYRSFRSAQHTFYALTDRRAIVFGDGTVRSFTPKLLASLSRTERPDGSGDLMFAQEPERVVHQRHISPVGFIGIREPKEVERIIRGHLLR